MTYYSDSEMRSHARTLDIARKGYIRGRKVHDSLKKIAARTIVTDVSVGVSVDRMMRVAIAAEMVESRKAA
jgi:hypothetical protein